MMRADPYTIKPLEEVDEDPGCSDYMKRCDSCKTLLTIYVNKCFATKKN